jgi:hypothetical protein
MRSSFSVCLVVFFSLILFDSQDALGAEPEWIVSRFIEPPLTWDGSHVIEGTAVAPAWSWHARGQVDYQYNLGLAERASQFRLQVTAGFGLPYGLEVALAIPAGVTVGSKDPGDIDTEHRELVGMGDDGGAFGDLSAVLMWRAIDAENGGFGMLLGLKGTAPTGDNERLMGEGNYTAEPFISMALQVFSSRLSLNLGYRIREERVVGTGDKKFEQDDDIIWRFGIRVPRKKDVAWSLEASGTIGVATSDGFWPDADSRPVWLGGGIDFPMGRLTRFGLFTGFGISQKSVPAISVGMNFSLLPLQSDEDEDGVTGKADQCPLLREDMDSFEDSDGCPDLDNDADGFPDDEDKCPLEPAQSDFSQDGC